MIRLVSFAVFFALLSGSVGMLPGSGELSVMAGDKELVGDKENDDSLITLDRIYKDHDFRPAWYGGAVWLFDTSYSRLEESKPHNSAYDVVVYDPAKNPRRILISASQLIPPPSGEPLRIEEVVWSTNGSQALIYTNSKRMWRYKT